MAMLSSEKLSELQKERKRIHKKKSKVGRPKKKKKRPTFKRGKVNWEKLSQFITKNGISVKVMSNIIEGVKNLPTE